MIYLENLLEVSSYFMAVVFLWSIRRLAEEDGLSDIDLIIHNLVLFFLFAIIGYLEFRKKWERRLWGASVAMIVAETFGFSQRLASEITFMVSFYVAMQGIPFTLNMFGCSELIHKAGFPPIRYHWKHPGSFCSLLEVRL